MKNLNLTQEPDIEALAFRRQFLLAQEPQASNRHWNVLTLPNEMFLSIHFELEHVIQIQNNVCIVLLGNVVDPHHPTRSTELITADLLEHFVDMELLFERSKSLCGRWVLICIKEGLSRIFTDPCGFRTVFYCKNETQTWCASQPELLRTQMELRLRTDPVFLDYTNNQLQASNEFAWVGDETIYEGCYHLLPNHYLDLENGTPIRFKLQSLLPILDENEALDRACGILQGTIEALSYRHKLSLPLTAGWDSRVLFAASRNFKDQIYYFVYQQNDMKMTHPDIVVAQAIALETGVSFDVKNPSEDLPEWFLKLLAKNVTGARYLSKTHSIYQCFLDSSNRITLNGNGSEICRNQFDKYARKNQSSLQIHELAACLYGQSNNTPYVEAQLEKWLADLGEISSSGFALLDYMYWEQRIGNWGAQFPAEQDVACEEISPFNNRELLEILIAFPKNDRIAPDFKLYKKLIQRMWPELLDFPINPHYYTRYTKIKQRLRKAVPKRAESSIRKFLRT